MKSRSQKDSEVIAESPNKTLQTDPFISVNERPVDDISLDLFYKPHTVTLLAVSIISVMYFAFVRYVYLLHSMKILLLLFIEQTTDISFIVFAFSNIYIPHV